MTDAELIETAKTAGLVRPRIIYKKMLSDVIVRQLMHGPDDGRRVIAFQADMTDEKIVGLIKLMAIG